MKHELTTRITVSEQKIEGAEFILLERFGFITYPDKQVKEVRDIMWLLPQEWEWLEKEIKSKKLPLIESFCITSPVREGSPSPPTKAKPGKCPNPTQDS